MILLVPRAGRTLEPSLKSRSRTNPLCGQQCRYAYAVNFRAGPDKDGAGRGRLGNGAARRNHAREPGVLSIKPFRRLWIALSLSSLGDWLSIVALTVLAPSLASPAAWRPRARPSAACGWRRCCPRCCSGRWPGRWRTGWTAGW